MVIIATFTKTKLPKMSLHILHHQLSVFCNTM